jgi:glycosyltransferase involved in cell wall biosynthesis
VRAAVCTSDYRIARHLRRTMALTDLAEAAAMRRALTRALARYRPRAIVFSSTQAAMLQQRAHLAGAAAVRFDALAAVNRPGLQNRLGHWLERRSLRRVAMLLPTGLEAAAKVPAELGAGKTIVPLPVPVELPSQVEHRRDPIALAYAGNPEKKGLDVTVAAWRAAGPRGLRLVVTGIDRDRALGYLRRRGVDDGAGVEWAGTVEPQRQRELVSRAEVVIAASRYEEYGLAQLEALANGALLVTAPSPGSYEALRLARSLEPALVAADLSAEALAAALQAALALPAEGRRTYRERARALVEPYSRAELKRRLESEVLPVLLG